MKKFGIRGIVVMVSLTGGVEAATPTFSMLSKIDQPTIYANSMPQTIGLEHQDRINRFHRLSAVHGIKSPQIDQLQLGPGSLPGINYPIPVVRVIFDAAVFFDFNKETIRPEAKELLNVIADNMRRDVPDAQLLVLGHTDAIGSDQYNIDLSMRRASFVMQELVSRGVLSAHLATVGIGKSQPRAPNSTDDGRALNRRVEFMISANQDANVALVQRRQINGDFLRLNVNDPPVHTVSTRVSVYSLVIPSSSRFKPHGNESTLQPLREISLQKPSPPVEYKLIPPTEYEKNKLNEFQVD